MTSLQSTSKPRTSVGSVFVYAALMTAMVYLLLFHLAANAPLRSGGNRPPGLAAGENIQAAIVGEMQQASQGKNLQLHLKLPEDLWPQANFFITIYYRAAYEFFPRRVFVGHDNRVINFPEDLKIADQLPNTQWLEQHEVPAVFWLLQGDQRGPGMWVTRVP